MIVRVTDERSSRTLIKGTDKLHTIHILTLSDEKEESLLVCAPGFVWSDGGKKIPEEVMIKVAERALSKEMAGQVSSFSWQVISDHDIWFNLQQRNGCAVSLLE